MKEITTIKYVKRITKMKALTEEDIKVGRYIELRFLRQEDRDGKNALVLLDDISYGKIIGVSDDEFVLKTTSKDYIFMTINLHNLPLIQYWKCDGYMILLGASEDDIRIEML